MAQYERMVGTWGWAVAGPVLFALAGAVGRVAREAAGGSTVVAAAVVAVLVVPGVLLLARRRGGADLLALRRPGAALAGLGVVGGGALVVFGLDAVLGGTRIEGVDAGVLALFVVATLLQAAVQEAVPEELAFRGQAFGVLRRSPLLAGVVTTALFVASACAGNALGALLVGDAVSPAPPGQAPLDYAVLLALFGVVLVLLRVVTGSLWACVAGHLTFLLVNRVLVASDGRTTGVAVSSPPGAELLVPAYLVLAAVVLGGVLAARSVTRRRSAAA